jgi:uncharacterized OsmC-like protein
MDSQSLRAIQAPLKAQYKEHPDSALVTLHAEAKLGSNVTAEVQTKFSTVVSGLHPATGGSGEEACSGDMLLQALTACAGVTMNAVATAMNIQLQSAKVSADGEIDFRGTLGVSKEVPVGFKNIKLHFDLKTDASQDQIDSLIKLTERYCVVFQTLKNPPEFSVTVYSVIPKEPKFAKGE